MKILHNNEKKTERNFHVVSVRNSNVLKYNVILTSSKNVTTPNK